MRIKLEARSKRALAFLGIALLMGGTHVWAQNLGGSPQTNVAVQGETGAQPEGAFLNHYRVADRPGVRAVAVCSRGALGRLRPDTAARILDCQRNRRCDLEKNKASGRNPGRQRELIPAACRNKDPTSRNECRPHNF